MKDFFTSLPGILIICGFVLLVVAIILFIIGAKKERSAKKANIKNEDINEENNNLTNSVNDTVVDEAIKAEFETVTEPNVLETVVATNDNSFETVKEDIVEPINNEIKQEEVVVNNEVNEEPKVENTLESSNTIENNSFDEYDFSLPDQEPIVIDAEDVKFDIPEEVPTDHQAYGGNEPVVDFKLPEVNHTIYGGNDPLEKTQNIKPINDTNLIYGEEPEVTVIETPIEVPTENTYEVPNVEPVTVVSEDEVVEVPQTIEVPTIEESSVIEDEPKVNDDVEEL